MSQRMAAGGIMQHQNGGDSGKNRFTILIVTCISQEFKGSIFERVSHNLFDNQKK
jgi:hypothetical protein